MIKKDMNQNLIKSDVDFVSDESEVFGVVDEFHLNSTKVFSSKDLMLLEKCAIVMGLWRITG
jgi:hypothetical protein